jgi:hypothetical protein
MALMEAILALTLAAMLFAALSLFAGTLIRRWDGLTARASALDAASVVAERMAADLEAALPALSVQGERAQAGFAGGPERVTFVRPAAGFEPRFGLDQVTYEIARDGRTPVLVRLRTDYAPAPSPAAAPAAPDRLELLKDASVRFSYAGASRAFEANWRERPSQPAWVRVEVSGANPRPWTAVAYARVRVSMPGECALETALEKCRIDIGDPP